MPISITSAELALEEKLRELGMGVPCTYRERSGRPDIAEYLRKTLKDVRERLIVAVCGGDSITSDVRNAAAIVPLEAARAGRDQAISVYVENPA